MFVSDVRMSVLDLLSGEGGDTASYGRYSVCNVEQEYGGNMQDFRKIY